MKDVKILGNNIDFSHEEGKLTFNVGPKFEISTYDGIDEKSIRLGIGEIRQLIPVLQGYLERTEEKK